ncbi:hypothetical protein A8C32_14260 [Flavivirga aquatica]|uniref:Uncharacterized protein n=1 Tax=Flavivirga aquatica TaxID=1849968 RepID=A0A1E5TCG6_9FLAO|nr:hypothetical protein A8C32_14260 [Flavivirga aquatica]
MAKKSFCESVNIYDIEECCHLHFLSWKNNVNKDLIDKILADLRNYKKDELNNNLEQDNEPKFFEYLNKIKESLLKKNILLIQYCESC